MTFVLGLAAVYMADRLTIAWNEVPVELPKARSAEIFHVFIDNSRIWTREKNCGKDPSDAQARVECTNQRLFGNRDMDLYVKFEIPHDPSNYDDDWPDYHSREAEKERYLVWRLWREKKRAHLIFHYAGAYGKSESHYFIEPYEKGRWQLVAQEKIFRTFLVDGSETEVGLVDDHPWSYKQARWKTATDDYGPYYISPGTRYLEFENETGDTISF